ncbi:hypothetical protein NIES267_62640 [Calothrix parasitica NIES-267]|uniref:Thiaminase-2/PQQC domain-containing protein n=1 Tax=Calothrix parasitica NIES-267 TaxID=1973488 RepID=A0A1Z4LZT8_9CYAN|nr:hypothetical protein NIES267_62640 [Calothrix parasitica NIES-267]
MLQDISEPGNKLSEFEIKQHQLPLPRYPRLAASVNHYQNEIIFSQEGRNFVFKVNCKTNKSLRKFMMMMDGTNSLSKLQETFARENPESINNLLHYLDENKLLDDAFHIKNNSGLEVLLELEYLSNKLFERKSDTNLFGLDKLNKSDLLTNIIYGFAIEAYCLFSYQADININYSVPSCESNAQIKKLINQLDNKEDAKDKFLAEALDCIGIKNEDLNDIIPLPQTMSICNALAYWASFDSLFYFSILGFLLNQNLINFTYYIQSCESVNINSNFIQSVRNLVNYLDSNKFENISRQIFQQISYIDEQTKQRLRRQTYLFIDIYTNLNPAILNYYSTTNHSLRRVSAI